MLSVFTNRLRRAFLSLIFSALTLIPSLAQGWAPVKATDLTVSQTGQVYIADQKVGMILKSKPLAVAKKGFSDWSVRSSRDWRASEWTRLPPLLSAESRLAGFVVQNQIERVALEFGRLQVDSRIRKLQRQPWGVGRTRPLPYPQFLRFVEEASEEVATVEPGDRQPVDLEVDLGLGLNGATADRFEHPLALQSRYSRAFTVSTGGKRRSGMGDSEQDPSCQECLSHR